MTADGSHSFGTDATGAAAAARGRTLLIGGEDGEEDCQCHTGGRSLFSRHLPAARLLPPDDTLLLPPPDVPPASRAPRGCFCRCSTRLKQPSCVVRCLRRCGWRCSPRGGLCCGPAACWMWWEQGGAVHPPMALGLSTRIGRGHRMERGALWRCCAKVILLPEIVPVIFRFGSSCVHERVSMRTCACIDMRAGCG